MTIAQKPLKIHIYLLLLKVLNLMYQLYKKIQTIALFILFQSIMAFSLPELNRLIITGGKWKNHISEITNHYCPLVLMVYTVLLHVNLRNCEMSEPLSNIYKYFSTKAEKNFTPMKYFRKLKDSATVCMQILDMVNIKIMLPKNKS